MKRYKRHIIVASMILAGLFVTGCVSSSGNYGRLVSDDTVKAGFENNKVDPQYNYYYYGTKTFPKAFIGLSKDLVLVSSFWKPIELTPEILHNWIWLHANRYSWNTNNYGSSIVTHTGEKIGVWYSLESWQQWTTIEMLSDNKVRVGSPEGGEDGLIWRRFASVSGWGF